jgi:hypothetical protein
MPVVKSFLNSAKEIFLSRQPKIFYARILDDYDFSTNSQKFERISPGTKQTLVIDPIYLWHLYPHTETIHIDGKTQPSETKTIESKNCPPVQFEHSHKISIDLKMNTRNQIPTTNDIVLMLEDQQTYYVIDIVYVNSIEK